MVAKIARVIDFETTGLPEDETSAICEAGFVDVDLTAPELPLGREWTSLINPRCPIPPQTMAVHHITDAEVADAPLVGEAWLQLAAGMMDDDIYVAHNAQFEQHFYTGRPQRWVCTWKCALRAWPEAPGHNNQVLRYWLGADVDPVKAMPPHRALPDAYVTAHILRKLLLLRPIERLVEISAEPGFLPKMTFGEHFGKKFSEIPSSYLEWMVGKMSGDKKRDAEVFTAKWWLQKKMETASC